MANSKNCNIVADAIEKSVTFNQGMWHRCKTPSCIGGHTVFELDPDFYHFDTTTAYTAFYFCKVDGKLVEKDIEDEAGKLLDLEVGKEYQLFDGSPFGHSKISNMGAARVLRHLGVTGIVDWEKAFEVEPIGEKAHGAQ